MRRRDLLISLLFAVVATSPAAQAQQASKIPRLGILSPRSSSSPVVDGVRAGLQELGYVEGQNIQIEYRWANGVFDRLADLATELVRLDVDVIVTHPAFLAAQVEVKLSGCRCRPALPRRFT